MIDPKRFVTREAIEMYGRRIEELLLAPVDPRAMFDPPPITSSKVVAYQRGLLQLAEPPPDKTKG